MAESVLLGQIGRPHGVRGQVHVRSFTDPEGNIAAYGPLHTACGRRFALRLVAPGIAELTDLAATPPRPVASRGEAERLTNTKLYVGRAALPAPAENEFYLADLVGLDAVGADGTPLGRVSAVHDYGAGASLEIGALLVPFTRSAVPQIDVAAGRLIVLPPRVIEAPALPAESAA